MHLGLEARPLFIQRAPVAVLGKLANACDVWPGGFERNAEFRCNFEGAVNVSAPNRLRPRVLAEIDKASFRPGVAREPFPSTLVGE